MGPSPYCTDDIPPQAAIKSPRSISFKSTVQGEWSDITKSMSPDFRACHKRSFRGGERKRRSVTEPNTRTQKLKTKPTNRLIYVPRCQSKKKWHKRNKQIGSKSTARYRLSVTDVRDLLFRSSPLTESPEQASKSAMRCYKAW